MIIIVNMLNIEEYCKILESYLRLVSPSEAVLSFLLEISAGVIPEIEKSLITKRHKRETTEDKKLLLTAPFEALESKGAVEASLLNTDLDAILV